MHQKIGCLQTKPVNPYQQINHPVRKSLRLLFKLLQPGLLDCLDLFLDDLQPLHVPSKGGAPTTPVPCRRAAVAWSRFSSSGLAMEPLDNHSTQASFCYGGIPLSKGMNRDRQRI